MPKSRGGAPLLKLRLKYRCLGIVALLICGATGISASWATEWVGFPKNFQWCVSTSAHQIEGNNENSDWWAWEQMDGHVRSGDHSGLACDHWGRVSEDVRLLSELRMKSYRLSIEWAKIEPSQGKYDNEVIEHYASEMRELRSVGITPIITLHHFTLPAWIRKNGGWEWEGVQDAFTRFAEIAYTQIAPKNLYWVTVNEPTVNIMEGYYTGIAPPGEKRNMQNISNVFKGMLKAHAQAYHRLHELADRDGSPIRIGMAHNLRYFAPASRFNPLDLLGATLAGKAFNWLIPNALSTGKLKIRYYPWLYLNEKIEGLAGTQDFFGVNYYSSDLIQFSIPNGYSVLPRTEALKSDLGWDIYPEGIYEVLKQVKSKFPPQPVMILENGVADASDRLRENFLKDHLFQVSRAIQEGVPVEGYCYWSLMDNFEWSEGFRPRFGLYEMDYSTFERKPRHSAEVYRDIAGQNGFFYK
jgi:beta-glucosidase